MDEILSAELKVSVQLSKMENWKAYELLIAHTCPKRCMQTLHTLDHYFLQGDHSFVERKRAVRIQWISDMADVQRTKKSTMGVCGREFRGEKFKETVSVALKAEMPLEGHVRLCQGIGGDETIVYDHRQSNIFKDIMDRAVFDSYPNTSEEHPVTTWTRGASDEVGHTGGARYKRHSVPPHRDWRLI